MPTYILILSDEQAHASNVNKAVGDGVRWRSNPKGAMLQVLRVEAVDDIEAVAAYRNSVVHNNDGRVPTREGWIEHLVGVYRAEQVIVDCVAERQKLVAESQSEEAVREREKKLAEFNRLKAELFPGV